MKDGSKVLFYFLKTLFFIVLELKKHFKTRRRILQKNARIETYVNAFCK
jgi:hypothetical protein